MIRYTENILYCIYVVYRLFSRERLRYTSFIKRIYHLSLQYDRPYTPDDDAPAYETVSWDITLCLWDASKRDHNVEMKCYCTSNGYLSVRFYDRKKGGGLTQRVVNRVESTASDVKYGVVYNGLWYYELTGARLRWLGMKLKPAPVPDNKYILFDHGRRGQYVI